MVLTRTSTLSMYFYYILLLCPFGEHLEKIMYECGSYVSEFSNLFKCTQFYLNVSINVC